jgi:hypothetical protein
MFILPLPSVQTLYDGNSVYTRRLRALKAFRGIKAFRSLRAFRALKAFRDSEVNPMSSLAHTWYVNTHPHMHRAEAGERVRVSSLYFFLLAC